MAQLQVLTRGIHVTLAVAVAMAMEYLHTVVSSIDGAAATCVCLRLSRSFSL